MASFGLAQSLGRRDTQEDRYLAVPDVGSTLGLQHITSVGFFAVFDGHMGYTAAEFARDNLLRNIVAQPLLSTHPGEAMDRAFRVTDEQFIGPRPALEQVPNLASVSGTTVGCAMVDFQRRRAVVGNVGDSRVVLCRSGSAVSLTRDHTCSMLTEEERVNVSRTRVAAVINTHMWITVPSVHALMAAAAVLDGQPPPAPLSGSAARFGARGSSLSLEVTRAIGDPLFKAAYNPSLAVAGLDLVSCVPDILDVQLDDECEFLVLGTDGLYSALSNEEVVACVRAALSAGQTTQQASETLVSLSLQRGCSDNVTAIIVRLR